MALLPTTRLLWLALAAALPLGLAAPVPALLPLWGLAVAGLAAVVVVDWRRSPRAGDFTVSRRHEPRLSLGENNPVDLSVAWEAATLPPGGTRVWLRDETPWEIPVDRLILDGRLGDDGGLAARYHLRPVRRGDYQFGATLLRVESPWRLLVRQHRYVTGAPLRVYPNLRAVHRYDALLRHGRLREAGLRRVRLRGGGTEFEQLRDYLPDDDVRRIDWKATARRNRPMAVDYETERSRHLMLVLDAGRLMGTRLAGLDKLDHAINTALVLAWVGLELGDRVGLCVFDDQVRRYLPPGRGKRQFQLLLDSLYNVRAQPVEADPARALEQLALRQQRRALVVLFSDLSDMQETTPLVAHLGLLARRHLPLCVTLSDPDVIRYAEQPPRDSDMAWQKVVAQRLLDERQATVEHLTRRGVATIDVPADRLTASVIDRYLELKARSRL